ncbi:MAG: DNA polymerase III subunit gamma/tau C-terminal domain-containing protein, partial [Luminiphilus sp.]
LPATILSRCLQFNLKNMVPEQVVEHLQAILADEGIAYELPALSLLGRAAAGSMRDALSLTDQAIAYGSGSLVESDVRDMLGTVDRNRVITLLSAVSSGDASAVLAGVDEISQHAPDYGATLEELIALLHQVTLMQMVPEMMQTQTAEEQSLVELARQMSLDESQLCYQFAINGRRDLPVAPDPRIALEMTLLRMIAFKPVEAPGRAGEPPRGAEEAPPAKKPEPPAQPVASQSAGHEGENRVSRGSPPAPQTSASGPPLPTPDNWPEFFETLGLVGITHSVALHLELMAVSGDRLEFVLDRNNATLFQERQVDTLALAFGQVLGRSVTVDIQLGEVGEQTPQHRRALRAAERQRQAELALNEDPELAALIAEFDGRLVEGSIRPR